MHRNDTVLTFEGLDVIHGVSEISSKEPWFCGIYI